MEENIFTNEGKAMVSKVWCDGDLRQNIGQAVAAIGGFQRLVEPGDMILVKPNFNTSDPPPGSSDPHFVKAVIELLYEHRAGKVVLGESSMIRLSTRDTLRQTGMLQAAEEAGAEVVVFDEGEMTGSSNKKGKHEAAIRGDTTPGPDAVTQVPESIPNLLRRVDGLERAF